MNKMYTFVMVNQSAAGRAQRRSRRRSPPAAPVLFFATAALAAAAAAGLPNPLPCSAARPRPALSCGDFPAAAASAAPAVAAGALLPLLLEPIPPLLSCRAGSRQHVVFWHAAGRFALTAAAGSCRLSAAMCFTRTPAQHGCSPWAAGRSSLHPAAAGPRPHTRAHPIEDRRCAPAAPGTSPGKSAAASAGNKGEACSWLGGTG